MAEDDAPYEFKFVRAMRGREARTITRWQDGGWEFVRQDQGRLRTEMTFRRVKPRTKWHPWAVAGVLLLALVIIAVTTTGPVAVDDLDGRVTGETVALIKDADRDGIPDQVETSGWRAKGGGIYRTDPDGADTDSDGLSDGEEAGRLGMTPWGEAYDGLSDPTELDSDGDGLDDATERDGDFDPWAKDSDGDSVDDLVEIEFGSDPLTPNADGDHLDDAGEMRGGSDPTFYDLTFDAALAAFVAGATFGGGRLDEAQRHSLPYLVGSIVRGLIKFGALRQLASSVLTRDWTAALKSLVGAVPGLDLAKASASAVRFAARSARAARTAMHFIATSPVLSDEAKSDILRTIIRLDPAKVRLASDAEVREAPAPSVLSTQRPISTSDSQNERKDEIVSELRSQGYTDIRVNQQQVDAAGQLVGINRPDIQATAQDGTRHYFVLDTESVDQGPRHMVRILSNDDTGEVQLIDQE